MNINFRKSKENKKIKVQLLSNWAPTIILMQQYNKMLFDDSKIEFVSQNPDYYVVFNATSDFHEPHKTLIFHMEPNIQYSPQWWSPKWMDYKTLRQTYFKLLAHETDYNNLEWHISKSAKELLVFHPVKTKIISTILSSKYVDEGHIKRINFVKFLESKNFEIDVYGNNKFKYKKYLGSLPHQCKDNGMFPYKYHFMAENTNIKNYFTEKMADSILSECLVFYWGCDNISEYIDNRAYIKLELNDFESDYNIIINAIKNDEWSKRIDIIRKEKIKILKKLCLVPRLEKLLC